MKKRKAICIWEGGGCWNFCFQPWDTLFLGSPPQPAAGAVTAGRGLAGFLSKGLASPRGDPAADSHERVEGHL